MAGTVTWQVRGQSGGQVINTLAGQTLTGTIVYFITGDGNEGSVFIEDNHYNEQHVRQAVRAAAARLDGVGRLAEGMAGG